MRRTSFVVAFCLLLTSIVFAQNKHTTRASGVHGAPTTCGSDPVLTGDGTASPQDLLFAATSAYYTLNAKAGHSYSVEVWDVVDQTAAVAPAIQLLASDCMTAVASTDVTNVDPDLSQGFSRRISWIQTAMDATIQIQVMNPDQNNPYTYQIRVTDTTLYNTRWSTFGGYITSWGFTNTTSTPIKGAVTVVDSNGQTVATSSPTLAANTATFLTTVDLNVPANDAGGSSFAYVGPPGAVIADGFLVSPGGTVVTPILYQSKHAYR